MGLTKQYLRYAPQASFGLIASTKGGLVRLGDKNLVATSTAESVSIWNLKTGVKDAELLNSSSNSNHQEVTALAISENQDKLAYGLNDGSIKMFCRDEDYEWSWEEHSGVVFNGHKSAITSLAFDQDGHRLASGSRDTNVIVWDTVNECGLYRLKGHKGPVTSVTFDQVRNNILVTSSKDTTVKFWDLNVQHCFKTLTEHIMEVWDFLLVKDYIITGTNDSELRIFKLIYNEKENNRTTLEPHMKRLKFVENAGEEDDDESDQEENEFDAGILKIERVGSLLRQGQDKVSHLTIDQGGRLMACHGTSDNSIEIFLVCSEEEVKKRLQKRVKKERRKNNGSTQQIDNSADLPSPTIQEEFRRLKSFKASGKVKHLQLTYNNKETTVEITVSTANNLIEIFLLNLNSSSDAKSADAIKVKTFDLLGHRSDVRSVSFSSCNTAIASVSHETLKIWNRSSLYCIRTIPSGYGLCSLFVPGDRHVIVGTKKGSLQIFDLDKAEMTEEVDTAHSKEIWSMALYPDKKGFVTASEDKTVKFWSFEPLKDQEGWSVLHTKSLQLEEEALNVQLSPDGRLIAVALMDSTVKIFFADSLKFFLSLYGHKLPVLTLDISYDSTIIVTASADKNVKIWGLDFGDCHKSIFAHDDNITSVKFVPNTHYFFTVSKDGLLKQWDADNFERIITLKGHVGEIWAQSISPNGKYVVTAGHDKTMRLWEKTQEPLVLEDERETERELEEEDQLATGDRPHANDQDREAGLPSKKTAGTERSAERLMEAIQTYKEYQNELNEAKMNNQEAPSLPLIMSMYPDIANAEDFMFQSLARIKSSELEETLLVLPLDYVIQLMEIMETLLKNDLKSEMIIRTFFFLTEIHFGPLSSSKTSKILIQSVQTLVSKQLQGLRDNVGFNLAALRHVQNEQDEEEKVKSLLEATTKYKDKKRRKKQKQRAIQTAIISI